MRRILGRIKNIYCHKTVKRIMSIVAEAVLFVALISWVSIGIALIYFWTNIPIVLAIFILGVVIAIITEFNDENTDL